MNYKLIIPTLLLLVVVFTGCQNTKNTNSNTSDLNIKANASSKKSPNILLIIADDMGLDAFNGYGVGKEEPKMPNLEKLSDNGVRFQNFWAYPTCTPTRASLITGKYGFRTNVVKVGDHLAQSETTIQKLIDNKTNGRYSSAVIGNLVLVDQIMFLV